MNKTQVPVAVPRAVQKIILDEDIPTEYPVDFLPASKILFESKVKDFLVAGLLILPDHGFDLREAHVDTYTRNLEMVSGVDLFGGPGWNAYKKMDANAPAYVVATIYGECLTWIVWP